MSAAQLQWRAAQWLALFLPRMQTQRAAGLPTRLAHFLIRNAWLRTRAGEAEVRPWPWAEFWPVARLVAPQLDAEAYVVGGLPRRCFKRFDYGPTHVWGSSRPGEAGRCVIAAHRGEQIDFLQRMQMGDTLYLEIAQGERKIYVVQDAAIRHRRELRAPYTVERDSLVLVARYEADIAPEPLHYVVQALPA